MSFTLSLLVVVALAAVVLGLVCYHLLGRLHLLERAVQGGLTPPSRRLAREEFERRFAVAAARAELAGHFECGVVLVMGPELVDDHTLARTLRQLPPSELLYLLSTESSPPTSAVAPHRIGTVDQAGLDLEALGIGTTPFAFALDEHKVRAARPVGGSADLTEFLAAYT